MLIFIIVEARSAYNAILGRSWIQRMEGVASTLHQVFHCKDVDGVGVAEIQGDLPSGKRCILSANKLMKKKSKNFGPISSSFAMTVDDLMGEKTKTLDTGEFIEEPNIEGVEELILDPNDKSRTVYAEKIYL